MNYCSYTFATALVPLNIFEYKIVLKLVVELQHLLISYPTSSTRYKEKEPIILHLKKNEFCEGVVKNRTYFKKTMNYLKDIELTTFNGDKCKIINDTHYSYQSIFIDVNNDFIKLIFNFKNGVCGFPDNTFKLNNYYAVRLLVVLYNKESFYPSLKLLQHITNNFNQDRPWLFVTRILKEPQQQYKELLKLEGFSYSVNYTKRNNHKIIKSVDIQNRIIIPSINNKLVSH